MYSDSNFWKNKKVLITGHTGFKGGWLGIWLSLLGAEVYGISLKPNSKPNLFELANLKDKIKSYIFDIRDFDKLCNSIYNIEPEIIFHLAAQPLVRASYKDPINTYTTNIIGSVNILEAVLKSNSIRSVVMVTTDKVYLNNECRIPFNENNTLGGFDPYSASKAASEIIISSYIKSFNSKNIGLSTARAGNVIGGGDWSEDRLIPDCVRSWNSDNKLYIRNPHSVRPWQHVLEPILGYLSLAETIYYNIDLSGPYNFGPNSNDLASVETVVKLASKYFGKGSFVFDNLINQPYESNWLALDNSKSKKILGISPRWDLDKTIEMTMLWYKNNSKAINAYDLCADQIKLYNMIY